MGKQPGIFQPQHDGSRITDASPGRSLNRSHNPAAEVPARHGDRPNIARDAGRGKAVHDLKIHGGMSKQTKSGPMAFGGDHATAIDSLSGREVVPNKDGAVANAHPLTTPPTAKNLKPVAATPGMRSRTAPHLPELGRALLDEAFANSAADDRAAHGRPTIKPTIKIET